MQEGSLKKDAAAKPYEHQPYPSVRYHRSGATQLVHSDDEHDTLTADPDWADTPAAFAEPAEAPIAETTVAEPAEKKTRRK
jgi:hypothetical protein